ncbi:TPR-like protein [Dioscorea alata]|uniref:TPR-like protein n=1 Tax=Dioscorea alata TaxID=55571 RepID=A0ACB7V5D7_DIOAL|nr:TPR-like protein [Dioscorea alata]
MAALTSTPRHLRTLALNHLSTNEATIIDHISSALDACSQPHHLPQAHALLLSSGLLSSHSLAAKFILSASSIGNLHHAHNLFDKIPQPNVFLYNTLIKSHSHHGSFSTILHLYAQMLWRGITPDGFTFPAVLKACGALRDVQTGLSIHCHLLRLGFDSDVFILNGLIAMYAKSGAIAVACKLFDHLPERNVVSWTSVISGCAQNGLPLHALRLFRDMRCSSDVKPDFVSLVSVLKAYTDVEDLVHGRSVHGLVIKGGFEDEPDLLITLTAMYAKCGCVLVAKSLFDCVLEPDVILWNAMISGYVKNGCCHEAVGLFRRMIASNVKPDSITIRSAILACAQVGSLEVGKWMGEYTAKSEFSNDVFVNTALIDMYSKCGSLAQAHQAFDRITCKDVVVWSALIVGYGWHGRAREAIEVFTRMRDAGVRPNDVTFIGLLSACNHAGLVAEGLKYFYLMREFGIEARHQHYACVVDLVARAGGVEEAYELIKSMPMEPAVTVWGALLNACNIYGNVELGEIAADRIFAVDPKNAGHYVQLSNIYASAGMWSNAARVRVMMKEKGVTKDVACSLI